MTQDEINEAQWADPENWSGPDWAALYCSKEDARVWVPKKMPWMGWTLNLGRPADVCWLIAFLVALSALLIVIGTLLITFLT